MLKTFIHVNMKTNEIILGISLVLLFSCDSGLENDEMVHVYKSKGDYSLNTPVEFSSDKSTITSAPGKCEPAQTLIQGFFLGNTLGENTGYLSMTIEEYNSHDPLLGVDSLYKYIMETDPFIEYYIGDIESVSNDYGIDTSLINTLIQENRLLEVFEKRK